jgi:hypothetical protein
VGVVASAPAKTPHHERHPAAHRDDHPAARTQLVDELGGHLVGIGRDEDPVVRREAWYAEHAGRRLPHRRPVTAPVPHVLLAPRGQLGDQLDADHEAFRSHEMGQERGGPARAGAHVEHPVTRLHVEQPQHRSDRSWLRAGLAVADRQRSVVRRSAALGGAQELVPGHGVERCRDPVPLQGHATSLPRVGVSGGRCAGR